MKTQSNISPSGKYRLEVEEVETLPGSWNYSKGTIVDNQEKRFERIVSTIQRNYASFPFCWAENHPDGHDYLLCGFDYQGITVVRLDTGERLDWLTPGSKNGGGFCHSNYEFKRNKNQLNTEGCVWACPFERVLYDFSDPMKLPWPELSRSYVDS